MHYLILEYVPGGELYTLLEKKGKLSEFEAKKYFYQLLTAVEYSHSHGVAHRDIKLENILLDEYKNIKLGDYGLSNSIIDGEFMTTACGSANYAAPEVITGQKYSGVEADIWSMGILLYTLVAGVLPFDEPNMPALLVKVKSARYSIPYHLSPQVTDLIEKMIVANPLYRLSISDIFRHPWIVDTFPIQPVCMPTSPKIDSEIVETLKQYSQFNGKSDEERKNRITNGVYDLFTVSYHMLLHTKQKEMGRDICIVKKVFKNVRCSSKAGPTPNDWNFCFYFDYLKEDFMRELCKSLKDLRTKWKFFTPFHLKIIKKDKNTGAKLKLEARVYEENKYYFLDLRLLIGNTICFLDFCHELYTIFANS